MDRKNRGVKEFSAKLDIGEERDTERERERDTKRERERE